MFSVYSSYFCIYVSVFTVLENVNTNNIACFYENANLLLYCYWHWFSIDFIRLIWLLSLLFISTNILSACYKDCLTKFVGHFFSPKSKMLVLPIYIAVSWSNCTDQFWTKLQISLAVQSLNIGWLSSVGIVRKNKNAFCIANIGGVFFYCFIACICDISVLFKVFFFKHTPKSDLIQISLIFCFPLKCFLIPTYHLLKIDLSLDCLFDPTYPKYHLFALY